MTRSQLYSIWNGIQRRCNSDGDRAKKWPTYNGVTCEFPSYEDFSEWAFACHGFGVQDRKGNFYQIDKDILPNPNRTYSKDTCCFIPPRLNSIFNACTYAKGKWPIGAHWNERDHVFYSKIRIDTLRVHLGTFNDPLLAHQAWQRAKISEIRKVVAEYKEWPGSDHRVIAAVLQKAAEIEKDLERGDETV